MAGINIRPPQLLPLRSQSKTNHTLLKLGQEKNDENERIKITDELKANTL